MSTSIKDLAEKAVKPLESVLQIHSPASTVGGFYEITHPITVQRCTNNTRDPDHQYRLEIFAPGYYNDVSYGASFFTKPLPMHQQNYFKLILVLQGDFYQIIEGKRILYAAGSLCLLSPDVRCSENFDTDYQVVIIAVLPGFIESLNRATGEFLFAREKKGLGLLVDFMKNYAQEPINMKTYYDFIPASGQEEIQQGLHENFDLMISIMQAPETGTTYYIQHLFSQICSVLENSDYYHINKIHLKTSADLITFSRITYLLEESSGRITRAELANRLKFNQYYLSRIVKKHTGMSLSDYRLSFRLEAASEMLLRSDTSIPDIMRELGCTNRTFFDRIFKAKFGVTPAVFRKNSRSSQHQI